MKFYLGVSLLILFLFSSQQAISQQSELSQPEPFFWAIIVEDIDTSINWYTKNLGLEVLYNNIYEERGFKQAALHRSNLLIELLEIDTSLTPNELMEGRSGGPITGFFKVGFRVEDFDKWHQKIQEAGVEFRGEVVNDPVSGKRMIIILDPDKNRIQLFEK